STPAAVAGYPSVTVPAGDAHGLPVGLSFIGGRWSEAKLNALAYPVEQATKHRPPPRLIPTPPPQQNGVRQTPLPHCAGLPPDPPAVRIGPDRRTRSPRSG